MNAQPTPTQRRILEQLAQGSVLRLPPWAKRVQLIAVGRPGSSVADPTFRALLRHGWLARKSGADSYVPSYGLSETGKQALQR